MISQALTVALLILAADPPDGGADLTLTLTEEDRELVTELELLENLEAASELELLEVLEDDTATKPR